MSFQLLAGFLAQGTFVTMAVLVGIALAITVASSVVLGFACPGRAKVLVQALCSLLLLTLLAYAVSQGKPAALMVGCFLAGWFMGMADVLWLNRTGYEQPGLKMSHTQR